VTFVSSTALAVQVTAPGTPNQLGDLVVTNPDGGTVTCSNCVKAI
jgi:hypothetical protein